MERDRLIKSAKSFYILMALILFQGASGLFGGGALVLDPTGNYLQMPISLLDSSPFNTYMIPGIILSVVLGIFPMVVFFGLWKRSNWAWTGALMVSSALIIWIGVEIWMVGYHPEPPLQLIYGIIGVALLMLTLMPSVRYEFRSERVNPKT